ATYAAVHLPSRAIPGRLCRAGTSPAGSTNETTSPGCWGVTVADSSTPPATCWRVTGPIAIGGGPSDDPAVRKTNGCGRRPQGMAASGGPDCSVQPPGAPGPRSSPGSSDATSQVAVASEPF